MTNHLPAAHVQLHVVYRNVEDLRPDPRNPRMHSRKQIKQITLCMRNFGFNVPVLVDADDRLITGHGRVLAARQLGMTEIPTICIAHLSPAQRKAFQIADNKLTENSTWNKKLLGEIMLELSMLKLDFSLEVTGFDMGEIDFRIEGLLEPPPAKSDPADTLPRRGEGPPVCQPGDLWQLGRHRLLCGSALDPASYAKLMDGAVARLVFSVTVASVSR